MNGLANLFLCFERRPLWSFQRRLKTDGFWSKDQEIPQSSKKPMALFRMVAQSMLFAAAFVAASPDPLAQWLDSLKFSLEDVPWLGGSKV